MDKTNRRERRPRRSDRRKPEVRYVCGHGAYAPHPTERRGGRSLRWCIFWLIKLHHIAVLLGEDDLHLRECGPELLRDDGHGGVFRMEVARVDEVDAQLIGGAVITIIEQSEKN